MKRTCWLLLLLLLALPATAEWNNVKNLKVAVLDLQSRVDNEAIDTTTLSELLLINLVDQNAFQVVERTLINRIIEEQEFQISDFSASEIAQIGTLAGANKIIAGSISKIGDTYFVIVKGIDTATAVIDLSDQVSSKTVDDLIGVFPVLASRLVRKANGDRVEPFRVDRIVVDQSVADPLAGDFDVSGKNPDGTGYAGTVSITESGGAYTVVWRLTLGQVFTGTGTRKGDRLTVDWGDTNPVIYTLGHNGRLEGIWGTGGAGSETLTRHQ